MPPWRRPETQQFRQMGWSRSKRTWGWRRGQPQAWWTQHSWGGLRCEWEISNLVDNLGKSVHAQKNSGSRSVKTLGFLFSTTKYSCIVLGWFHSISRNKCLTSPKQRVSTKLLLTTILVTWRNGKVSLFWDLDSPNFGTWTGTERGLINCQIAPVEKKVPFIGQKLIPAIMKFIEIEISFF